MTATKTAALMSGLVRNMRAEARFSARILKNRAMPQLSFFRIQHSALRILHLRCPIGEHFRQSRPSGFRRVQLPYGTPTFAERSEDEG